MKEKSMRLFDLTHFAGRNDDIASNSAVISIRETLF